MIYTFYSYKGGVGRTHLLANIAAYLCYYENKRILLIDWDLEAPGLHYYFGKKNEDIECKGLTELLNAHIDLFRNAAPDKTLSEKDFVSPFATNDYIQNMRTAEKGGKIDLMPAANYAEGYNTRIEDFDWIRFYDQFYGGSYLLWLRQELKKKYDFVLIDSRTGFNDYSGICNVLMPDMNVVLVAPNEQNFEGAKRMIRRIYDSSFTKSESRKPYVLPVLTRLDTSDERADEWRAKFAAEFAFTIGKLDKNLEAFGKEILELVSAMTYIAYNRRFSIGERLQFKEEAKPIIAGSDLTNFQNIAVQFLKKMNDTGSIDLNAMIGDKMMPVYLRNILENPQDYDSLFGLAYAYHKQDNYTEAQRYYEKIVAVKPDFHEAWNNLGLTYHNLENYAKAVECYQKAIEIKPDFHEAWYNLGLVYRKLENYAKAVECYQKAIEIKPDHTTSYYWLGYAFYEQNKFENQVLTYLKLVEINPHYKNAWNNLGFGYVRLGLFEKAIPYFEKEIENNPDESSLSVYNLGICYCGLKNKEKALSYLQQAISLNLKHKAQAQTDPDFEWLWADADFRKMTE